MNEIKLRKIGDVVQLKGNPLDEQLGESLPIGVDFSITDVSTTQSSPVRYKIDGHHDWIDSEWFIDPPIDASKLLINGFPDAIGKQFAVDVLRIVHKTGRSIDGLVIDLTKLGRTQSTGLISSFFTSFMERMYEEDPDYAESATKIHWITTYDWQKENIKRFLEPWREDSTLVCRGIRHIEKPQNLQIGLPPAFPKPVINVISHDGMSYAIPISNEAAEVLIANGMSYEG